MQNTGERQTAGCLELIKPDHLQRYVWAAQQMHRLGGYMERPLVADIACGNGYGSYILSAVARVIGIDIEAEAVSFAREHYRRTESNPTFVLGDATTLCINQPVEAVVSFETLEHVSRADAEIMLELYSSITDRVFLSVPNETITPYAPDDFPFHHRHYTPDQFEALLEGCGWEIAQWWTQYDKSPGKLLEGDDGRTLIVEAIKSWM